MILAERYLRKRFEAGRQQTMAEWVAWNNRRLEAERRGLPFHEPPPSEKNGASAG